MTKIEMADILFKNKGICIVGSQWADNASKETLSLHVSKRWFYIGVSEETFRKLAVRDAVDFSLDSS